MNLPTGTITFLFTDIEGSTKLWEQSPDAMRVALARHDTLMKNAIVQNEGYLVKTTGDGFFAAFATAPAALAAAVAFQQALHNEVWSEEAVIKVRAGLHTGAAEMRDGDYFGPTLNRAARLMSVGYGGQILLSLPTYELVRDQVPPEVTLRDMGAHRLKDLTRPEQIFHVLHPELAQDFPPLKTLDNPTLPNNLPRQLTTFIGREKEIAEVTSLLRKTSLLTVTGTGGCGKTRLTLQVAADMLEEFPDGVWFVELAPLTEPGLVAQTVAQVLNLPEQMSKSFTQVVTESLVDKRLLIVLDNCEHLLTACAQIANSLLRSCPHVKILASSREAMGIGGEQTYRVPSLSLPNLKQVTLENVSAYEAVRLFIERALLCRPDFVVTNQNAPALASVCHHLDGIPLAIELAAARVRSLTVEEINERLDNRFRLLTGGSRTALPRQQTLRAAIDWSYDLLNVQERWFLSQLSVFAGGWTLAAVEGICSDDTIADFETLDFLTSLVDKSLVMVERSEERTRYRLLESVRQYAANRLEESGGRLPVRVRHRDYFVRLAEEAEPKLRGAEQGHWLSVLESEHDNLRQALTFCLEDAEGGIAGLHLGGALQRFWMIRGPLSEGRERLRALLSQASAQEPTAARALALNGAATLALFQGDYTSARALFEESLTIRRELGDQEGIAQSLGNLGNVAHEQGDYASARTRLEESLAIRRVLGERRSIAAALGNLGNVALDQGDSTSARALYEESLGIFRELGDQQAIAYCLYNVGSIAVDQSDSASARSLFNESVALLRELGDRRGMAICLLSLGNAALEQDDIVSARELFAESLTIAYELGNTPGIPYCLESFASLGVKEDRKLYSSLLWGAATALRETIGSPLPPTDREKQEHAIASVRASLGEAAFAAAWEEGRALKMEQSVQRALVLDSREAQTGIPFL